MHVDRGKSQLSDDKLSLKGAWSLSRDLFNFWKINDNISKTVRDSLIVSIKFEFDVQDECVSHSLRTTTCP